MLLHISSTNWSVFSLCTFLLSGHGTLWKRGLCAWYIALGDEVYCQDYNMGFAIHWSPSPDFRPIVNSRSTIFFKYVSWLIYTRKCIFQTTFAFYFFFPIPCCMCDALWYSVYIIGQSYYLFFNVLFVLFLSLWDACLLFSDHIKNQKQPHRWRNG